jgi:uncharacterized membrane protein YphA (DoxX/SURF4 family)
MEHYRPPQLAPPGLILRDAGLLILRFCAGLTLIIFHAWREVLHGWQHVWHKAAWPYAVEVADRGFPLPVAVAVASAVVALIASAFIAAGLLCRLSALVLLVGSVVGVMLYGSAAEPAEKLVLYAGIYLVLVICGAGRFSLDALPGSRRGAKR